MQKYTRSGLMTSGCYPKERNEELSTKMLGLAEPPPDKAHHPARG
jgi:hypothetical protein